MAAVSVLEPFKSSFIKIERAKRHIKEIEEMAAAYWAANSVKHRYDPTPPEGRRTGFQFHVSVEAVPEQMSAAVGDVIHNLRAALDLLACDLCRINNQSADDVYFPFCEDANFLDKMIVKRHFDRAGDDAVRLLREIKPYKGGHIMLRAIHDLDVRDKHQMLLLLPISIYSPIFTFHDKDGKLQTDADGNHVVRFISDPNHPSEKKLVFPDDCALAGRELVPTLHELVEATAGIVESFKALSAPAGQAPV